MTGAYPSPGFVSALDRGRDDALTLPAAQCTDALVHPVPVGETRTGCKSGPFQDEALTDAQS